jgi:uncharacterized protein YaiE (UPF0345 family)
MVSPNSTFTELVTTTLRNHPKEITDNVSLNNAFLTYLKDKGKIDTMGGGYEIVEPLEYAENSTYQRFSGYDALNTSASDVLSAAKYSWCQIALHVVASGREIRMNSGQEAMIKLVKARIKNAYHTAANNMSIDLYGSGALSNQIGGLGHLITSDGTGTVGGIVASTYTFWKNQFFECSTAPGVTTMTGHMNTMWTRTVRGADKTDLIVASHDFYNFYEGQLQALQRYADSKSASAGFEMLKYKTANVLFDSNTNFSTTQEVMYFLNTKYIKLVAHKDANWSQDDDKVPVNQDAVIVPIYWMGQMVCSNRSLQGKLIDEM